MPYYSKGKCIYKKKTNKKVGCTKGPIENYMAALHANVEESLDTSKVGSNLEFKSVIPNADKTEVSVFYGVKSDPGTDLVLIFALGQTADDSDYLYGVTYDKNDPKGRPQKFEDPSSKEAIALLKTYHLTSNDVEMAGQDAYEKIADNVFATSKVLEEPYEESLEFESLFSKLIQD